MTDRLRNDVIFVHSDGCLDYHNPSTQDKCIDRLNRISTIKQYLVSQGLRVLLLNPINGDVPYVPYFPSHFHHDSTYYNYSSFSIFDLLPTIESVTTDFTHIVIFQPDGFPINVDKWDDTFLEYDYLGIKESEAHMMCSGFCIRSKEHMRNVIQNFSINEYITFFKKHKHGNDDVVFDQLALHHEPPFELVQQFGTSQITTDHFGFHTHKDFDFDEVRLLWNITV
jgi:hypothetical protein